MLNSSRNTPLNFKSIIEIMPTPRSLHVYNTPHQTLPFQSTALDALFFVCANRWGKANPIFKEAYRVLKMNGLLFIKGEYGLDKLQRIGFELFDSGPPELNQTTPNWRAAYVIKQNGRLLITELEKSHIYPFKSPFFKTAVCVIKPTVSQSD